MSTIDALLEKNRAYAAGHARCDLPKHPSRRLAIVTCMDGRLDVHTLLGLERGEAHIIRNAGSVVTDDVIRSLVISQRQLGTREIMVVHHTDCGMLSVSDEELMEQIQRDTGIRPPFPMETFRDSEEAVRESIARIAACPFLPSKSVVRGFVCEVATGCLREVS